LPPHDQFEVDLIWLSEEKGQSGRRYLLKIGSCSTSASITKLSTVSLESNQKTGQTSSIQVNQISRVNIKTTEKLALEPFAQESELGKFILSDPNTGQTVAVGTVNFALRRSENITRHVSQVTNQMHAELLQTDPKVIWFTGLSGSGKSTMANALGVDLHRQGKPHFLLDGDNLRFGLNQDLGFTEEDRTENIRRTAEVASLMADAGLIVLVALVSPLEKDRRLAKQIVGNGRFRLVYVATPLDVCEARDPKGLYQKARSGKIPNFTGVTSPYEEPKLAEYRAHQDSDPVELGLELGL